MDKIVKGLPGKHKADDEATANTPNTKTKTRKYVAVATIRSKEPDLTANCRLVDYLFTEKQRIVAHLSLGTTELMSWHTTTISNGFPQAQKESADFFGVCFQQWFIIIYFFHLFFNQIHSFYITCKNTGVVLYKVWPHLFAAYFGIEL